MKPNDGGGTRYFIKPDGHEKPVRVAVSDNGYILKAFPDGDATEYFN